MIRQLLILTFLIYSCSEEQRRDDSTYKSEDSLTTLDVNKRSIKHRISDTIFIHREVTKEYYHAIYIDTTRKSENYKHLTNFVFNKYDKESYEGAYKSIKSKIPNRYKRKNSSNLPEQWIPVYKYKDKYYLYSPSDWGNAGRLMINDSSFVFWYMDGLFPVPIESIKQQYKGKYILKVTPMSDWDSPVEKVTISEIDQKTKLSVFEFYGKSDERKDASLYIPVKSAKYFDMIINKSTMKQLEFEFDKIDYQKLKKESKDN